MRKREKRITAIDVAHGGTDILPADVLASLEKSVTTSESFGDLLYRSSVPLRRVESDGSPSGAGSGFLIDYGGRRILLTVSHVTKDESNWAIELEYHPGNGTRMYRLGSLNLLKRYNINDSTSKKLILPM